jgi:DNA-binding response OmpR family regulator
MTSVPLQSEALPPIVLIVDSDQTALALYSAEFERAGLWAAASTNPVEALEAVLELRPDLVITSAFDDADNDVVRMLKSDAATSGVPVILLADRPDDTGIAGEVADIRLQKPVATDVLLECSRKLIARSRDARKRTDPLRRPVHQLLKSSELNGNQLRTMRRCPKCGKPLEWIERGRLNGVEHDYYRWCASGCGLYCYELVSDTWVKLV